MTNLSPEEVPTLVTKAFCLEAIADKADCTSRFVDLQDKPLEGFIIAGINSATHFADFTTERLAGSKSVYNHNFDALKDSNKGKSGKFINFGLLEIMFPVVAARLDCDKPENVVKAINVVLNEAPASDVAEMLRTRELAWSTSNNDNKKEIELPEVKAQLSSASNPAEFLKILKDLKVGVSSRQWSEQYRQGWPLLNEIFDGLRTSDKSSLLDKITAVFNPIRERNQDIRIGILADMSAAAIFLYLSFKNN